MGIIAVALKIIFLVAGCLAIAACVTVLAVLVACAIEMLGGADG